MDHEGRSPAADLAELLAACEGLMGADSFLPSGDPVGYDSADERGELNCVFCGGRTHTSLEDWEELDEWRLSHADDCPWVKMVNIVNRLKSQRPK